MCGLDTRVSGTPSGDEMPGHFRDHGDNGMESLGPTVTVGRMESVLQT